MASTLGRNLHLCFTKIKRPTSPKSSSSSAPLTPEDHSHPTPNSIIDQENTTTSSSILVKNFNSLYELHFDSTSNSKSLLTHSSDDHSSSESDTDSTTPDFTAVFASHRFFFSSPGRSNSIIDSSSSISSPSPGEPPESDTLVGGVAIPTYSPDPYKDFRRSMQEMVEARDLMDVRANWDYLHELLLCYLALNPKSTHKFIVGAFADLLVSLVTSQPEDGGRESEFAGGGSINSSRACD